MEFTAEELETLAAKGLHINRLVERGLPPEQWSDQLRQSLEIASGRDTSNRSSALQRPTAYHYPGLPQACFYDPAQFEWAAAIEAAAPAIREELDQLLRDQGTGEFRSYIHGVNPTTELGDNRKLLGSKNWSVLSLCENGWVAPDLIERCPVTWQTILQAPVPRISGWGPTILFSLLKGGAHIAAHHGMYNSRLICHLPLIVPPNCRFRVGDEVREWEAGKLMIFDDSIEHEAWNDSDEDRILLIFDIWRPEFSDQERREQTLLFSD